MLVVTKQKKLKKKLTLSGEGLGESVGVRGWEKAFGIAGMRGNVEDPGGMVDAIEGRFVAIGGKLAIGGGRLATIGGRPLDGLALSSGPGRLPGWQNRK